MADRTNNGAAQPQQDDNAAALQQTGEIVARSQQLAETTGPSAPDARGGHGDYNAGESHSQFGGEYPRGGLGGRGDGSSRGNRRGQPGGRGPRDARGAHGGRGGGSQRGGRGGRWGESAYGGRGGRGRGGSPPVRFCRSCGNQLVPSDRTTCGACRIRRTNEPAMASANEIAAPNSGARGQGAIGGAGEFGFRPLAPVGLARGSGSGPPWDWQQLEHNRQQNRQDRQDRLDREERDRQREREERREEREREERERREERRERAEREEREWREQRAAREEAARRRELSPGRGSRNDSYRHRSPVRQSGAVDHLYRPAGRQVPVPCKHCLENGRTAAANSHYYHECNHIGWQARRQARIRFETAIHTQTTQPQPPPQPPLQESLQLVVTAVVAEDPSVPGTSTASSTITPQSAIGQALRDNLEHFAQTSEQRGRSHLQVATAFRAQLWAGRFIAMANGGEAEQSRELYAWLDAYIAFLQSQG